MLAGVLLLTSCASVFTGSKRSVLFESNPAGAKVYVTVSDGTSWEGVTDAKGKIIWKERPDKKGRYILTGKEYTLKAEKEGFYEDKKGAKISTLGMDQSQSFLINITIRS